jgi:DNA-binding NarL/FixJ family response regulator
LKILIADDHAVVRKGVIRILTDAFPDATIVEVIDSAGLLSQITKAVWDIVITDISMPGRSGSEVIKEIRQLAPKTSILMLSVHPAEQYALRTIKAGASGYLSKDTTPEELVMAIEVIKSGKKYLTTKVVELLANSIDFNYKEVAHNTLTNREFEILKMIVSGKTIVQISAEISMSKHSISASKAKILEKLHLHTNAEMIRYAIENKLWTD